MELVFAAVHPNDPVAAGLIDALSEEIARLYADTYPMDGRSDFRPEAHDESTDVFVVAFETQATVSVPVGCGAIRRFTPGTGEVKRMYVRPSARGHGVGRALLGRLEDEARRLGYERVVLETGDQQPEALALYETSGYSRTTPWPPYDTRDYSRCFEKLLA